jgi:hypothetical protein
MKLFCACLLVSSLLVQVSCTAGPQYREVRRQAPGGGWYVERVPVLPGEATAPARPLLREDSWWRGDHLSGSPSMTINLTEQRIYYYKGAQLAGVSIISSGREGYDTPTGSFKITQKNRDHQSSLYGNYVDAHGNILQKEVDVRRDPKPPGARFDGADMRYFMRVTGAVGMHEGYLPGFPASHGCIRLPPHMAHVFFRETPPGTPVRIVGRTPARPPVWAVQAPPPPGPPARSLPGRVLDTLLPPSPTRPVAARPTRLAPAPRGATYFLE